ncbi:MAG: tetratricopeptide repeat protein [bacterium]
MKTIWKIAHGPAVVLWLCWCGAPVYAQSQNAQAVKWFKAGSQAADADTKIADFLKALELDPDYVEALHHLGLAYKQKQDYRQAEQYLARALGARPPEETRLRVTFELAGVFRHNGKHQQAEEAFRQARNLASDPAMRSTIALELGRLLYEQGEYQEALVELREGQKSGGANAVQFETLIIQVQVESELLRLYGTASSAQAGGNLKQAQALFEQIQQTRPNYKDVDARLASLSLSLGSEQKHEDVGVLYDRAQKLAQDGSLEMAITAYESVLRQDPAYKDTAVKLAAVRKQVAQKQRGQLAEEKYAEGLSAFKERDWTRAIVAFEKVVGMDGGFRDARKRLSEAQRELDRESSETVAARYYGDGVAAMKRKDLGGALAAFEKVQRLNPRYRNVQTLLAEVEQTLTPSGRSEMDLQEPADSPVPGAVPRADLDSLYQQAVAAVDQQDWMAAVLAFEKLQILHPNYRDVARHLGAARARLNAAVKPIPAAPMAAHESTNGERGATIWPWAGGVALLFVVPLLGAVMLSPNLRARYQMFRGNYSGAMQIYEHQLARHPERTRLYPPLASLYLLLGRKDERALKVFKTVLQLNLPVPNRDEINGIVAQQFLTEGRTDSDAIEVLENALRSERQKQLPSGRAS